MPSRSQPFVCTTQVPDRPVPSGWASYGLTEQGRWLFDVVYDPTQHDIVIGIGRLGRRQRHELSDAGYEPLVALGNHPVWFRSRSEAPVISLEHHRVQTKCVLARPVPVTRRHR